MLKYLLHTKKRTKLSDGLGYPIPSNKEFLVLFMIEPTEEEELKVSKDWKIDLKILRNYPKEPTSKTFSTEPLQLVFGDYYINGNNDIKYARILLTVSKNALIITIPSKINYYVNFLDELQLKMKNNPKEYDSIGTILYEFIDDHTQDNYDVLMITEEKIVKLEQKVLDFDNKEFVNINEIVELKRELLRMSRRFWSTAKIIFLLKKRLIGVELSEKTARLVDGVYETYQHQLDILSSQREMISDALSIYATSISNRLAKTSNDLNVIMKKLTSLTVIVMVPTLIASMYGMNFKYLPAATADYGFLEITALMVGLSLVFYYYFHKRDWI